VALAEAEAVQKTSSVEAEAVVAVPRCREMFVPEAVEPLWRM